MKRVAIIGGGVFGSTAAIYAARAGYETHLFEERSGLMQAASSINQYRLHRGYHYPRSPETARSALRAEALFREEYGEAVIDHGRNIYAIAKKGSFVSGDEFLLFCHRHGLAYEVIDPTGLVNPDLIELTVEVSEGWYDPHVLKKIVQKKIEETEVCTHFNKRVQSGDLKNFDNIIIAAYAESNSVLAPSHVDLREHYQFEVCEKPVVTLPRSFGLKGIVIIDGPFMCVDPIGMSHSYVLGNVVGAIHKSTVGHTPSIPRELKPFLNRGIVNNPPNTKISEFLSHGGQYIPALKKARHIGSMFTIRTVLPNVEKTDARPTIVKALDDRHVRIFSGKIGNCVEAAKTALEIIRASTVRGASAPVRQSGKR